VRDEGLACEIEMQMPAIAQFLGEVEGADDRPFAANRDRLGAHADDHFGARREARVAAPIERLWRSLKHECVYIHAFETGSELRAGLNRWITYYNSQRPHTALGGATPDEAYTQNGAKPDLRPEPHNPDTSLPRPQNCPTNGGQLTER
jgi:Integrase core domain